MSYINFNKKNTLLASVIIPNWNGLKLLKICLTSLNKQSLKDFEVIVVDNGSTDSSVMYIRKNFPKFRIIQLPENKGFAAAVNIGIKKALGKYIVLLNNDTEMDGNCLRYLVEAAKNHANIGFIAAKIMNYYKRNIVDNAGDDIDSVGHLLVRGYGKKNSPIYNLQYPLFLATGGGSLFKREVFKKIGYFDEDYFLYMEDADLCFRAQLAGFKGWFESKAKIYHKRMATSSKNPGLVACLNFRNMTMNIIKDFPLSLLLYDNNWLKIILVNINTIKYLAGKGYLWRALKMDWYILKNFKKLLKKRKKIQKLKVVSDQYIINNVKEKKILLPFFKIHF